MAKITTRFATAIPSPQLVCEALPALSARRSAALDLTAEDGTTIRPWDS
jgi:hypothetical protein